MTVDLTVAIQTVPARGELAQRVERALAPLEALLVVDENHEGTWSAYRRCLVEGPRGSHRLVVQDDALLVDGFAELALAAVAAKPTRIVCLYTPALPSHYGRPLAQAWEQGAAFVELVTRGLFLPLVATVWPVELADEFAHWPGHGRFRRERADDARAADWLRATRKQPVACVPCLADHDEAAPSVLGNGGRYSRRAAVLPSTPRGELTIA